MAFLDNSGDIILDAVLTDAGRQRMARGEFKIVKFAFGDEEINYKLFNGNHPSGSAFADIQIMQTPILEAFTNNTSMMKTKLISLNRNNILYLPILRVNEKPELNDAGTRGGNHVKASASGDLGGFPSGWILLADLATSQLVQQGGGAATTRMGVLYHSLAAVDQPDAYKKYISVDQGLETGHRVPIDTPMPDDLLESAFLIRMDHRLLRLHVNHTGNGGIGNYGTGVKNSFVDDDAIATYYVGSGQLQRPRSIAAQAVGNDARAVQIAAEVFRGPLGPRLNIHPVSSLHIQQSDALFDEIGSTGIGLTLGDAVAFTYKYIDTLINVVGITTGISIDLPIRIIKKS